MVVESFMGQPNVTLLRIHVQDLGQVIDNVSARTRVGYVQPGAVASYGFKPCDITREAVIFQLGGEFIHKRL